MPPRLGADTRETLLAAGLSVAAVDSLLESGAAKQHAMGSTK